MNPLLGSWKLKSYVVVGACGERSTPYGEHPRGYVHYGADGRVQVIGVSGNRLRPAGPSPPDHERLALYDSSFAYAGTYSVGAGTVTHHVDVSWNESWTGTDQIRTFDVQGNHLTLTMHLVDAETRAETRYVAVWEKVAG